MKYERIDELRQEYPVAAMCRVLDVSESGYHAWRKRLPSPRAQENARLEIEIRAAHERTRQTYGPERLQQAKREITEYIEIFYNRIRKQARLGHLSPAAFSQQYYAMQMAA